MNIITLDVGIVRYQLPADQLRELRALLNRPTNLELVRAAHRRGWRFRPAPTLDGVIAISKPN